MKILCSLMVLAVLIGGAPVKAMETTPDLVRVSIYDFPATKTARKIVDASKNTWAGGVSVNLKDSESECSVNLLKREKFGVYNVQINFKVGDQRTEAVGHVIPGDFFHVRIGSKSCSLIPAPYYTDDE